VAVISACRLGIKAFNSLCALAQAVALVFGKVHHVSNGSNKAAAIIDQVQMRIRPARRLDVRATRSVPGYRGVEDSPGLHDPCCPIG